MKKFILLLFVLSSFNAFSKTLIDSTKLILYQARSMADPKSPKYNPQKAFESYHKLASQGNTEAMNGLGMIYSQGIGISIDDKQALSWFQKSANGGYHHAWYNLALIYKTGVGTEIDLVKAYQSYKHGADLDDGLCCYGQGYMLYKGYGCKQNYNQAVVLFKKGASLHNEGSYYMLGLCYRNGYGLAVKIDSAKYWLKRAAALGDTRAVNELADSTPENLDLKDVTDIQPSTSNFSQRIDLKSGFKPIQHHIVKDDIAGNYTGYSVKFDWSGKHIIGQAVLKLRLERKAKNLSGEWQEEGQEPFTINAALTDTDVLFTNSNYKQIDHYHEKKPLPTELKESRLNLLKSKDTVFLTGSIRKFSTNFKESQKPEFIMLIRTKNKDSTTIDSAFNNSANTKTDSIHFVAYPNPFISNLKLRYTLKKAAVVSIFVSDLRRGTIVYKSEGQLYASGDYDTPVNFNGQPGSYIVTLRYGGKVKSAIVFKN